jgi:hypothetical protein
VTLKGEKSGALLGSLDQQLTLSVGKEAQVKNEKNLAVARV